MAIAEQFAGLEMDKLIGAPLAAAADASINLANSTAEFINRVGFDSAGNVRNVAFKYEKRSANEDGTSNLDEMKVDVPILAIVPIPNLQVDEVNVLFDMEVKQSEKQDTSFDVGASVTGSLGIGPIKVSVTGSVSVHSNHTRSSDNSAKYHVDVRATNHGIPEGLARVLDMMAANVAPSLVGSTIKDGNGQTLSDAARIKAERLKTLRSDISSIETRLLRAQDNLSNSITQLKNFGSSQQNVYQAEILKLINASNNDSDMDSYQEVMGEINQAWANFQNQAGNIVKMLADSNDANNGKTVSELFALKALENKKAVNYENKNGNYYDKLVLAQKNAVDAQKQVTSIENEYNEKKAEYNEAIAGKAAEAKKITGNTEETVK